MGATVGKLKWYARDPRAALAGMMELSLEERGAYNTILDLIYCHDGAIDDDAHSVAGWLRVDARVWKRLRQRLLAAGKLYCRDGKLRNERADAEVDKALHRCLVASEAGRISAHKRLNGYNHFNGLNTSKHWIYCHHPSIGF